MRARALVMAGVLMALIAQFPLEGWADHSDLGHWIQHGILFWSGIVAGSGGLVLYREGQQRA